MRLDVTSDDDIALLAQDIEERFGRLDMLVNNAAITYDTWQLASGVILVKSHNH